MLIYHCQYCSVGKECMKAVVASPRPSKRRIGKKKKSTIAAALLLSGKENICVGDAQVWVLLYGPGEFFIVILLVQ